jgi:hypothetical protein
LRVSGPSQNGSAGQGRAHEKRTHAGDVNVSGTIEDQQWLLDEHGFGHHGTRATGTGESRNPRNAQEFSNSHAQVVLARVCPVQGAPDIELARARPSLYFRRFFVLFSVRGLVGSIASTGRVLFGVQCERSGTASVLTYISVGGVTHPWSRRPVFVEMGHPPVKAVWTEEKASSPPPVLFGYDGHRPVARWAFDIRRCFELRSRNARSHGHASQSMTSMWKFCEPCFQATHM